MVKLFKLQKTEKEHEEKAQKMKDMMDDDSLPTVSIITPTFNRRHFYKLTINTFLNIRYPKDKLEWIIVDDGTEEIEDTLIGIPNVKYIKLPEKMSIGQKRNIGIENAMYDYICMMDDDDVYPNNSILQRIIMLLKQPLKECTFCTTIPCYDIEKYSSFMNVPPITLEMSQRVSEATLCFTKKFWEERKFDGGARVSNFRVRPKRNYAQQEEEVPQPVCQPALHFRLRTKRKLRHGPRQNSNILP